MKQLMTSSLLALSLASGSVLAAQPGQQDLEMIFAQQDKPMQVQGLSHQEMVETEGDLAWFFIAAVVISAGVQYATTGEVRAGTTASHGISTVAGVAGSVGGHAGSAAASSVAHGLTASWKGLDPIRRLQIQNPALYHQLKLMGRI